jgi:hypothetical protein
MDGVGASLGFCIGDAVVVMVCGCCFAEASVPEPENGHQLIVRGVYVYRTRRGTRDALFGSFAVGAEPMA